VEHNKTSHLFRFAYVCTVHVIVVYFRVIINDAAESL